MKLIGTYFSPYARRVGVALVSRGLLFDHEPINGYREGETARQYNPLGKVPSLVLDDGDVLIDSSAILDYLNELTPHAPLIPHSSSERRRTLKLAAIGYGICEQAIQLVSREAEVLPSQADRWRAQIQDGLTALDAAAKEGSPLQTMPIDAAVITAVVAFEHIGRKDVGFNVSVVAPALTALSLSHRDTPPFVLTRPT